MGRTEALGIPRRVKEAVARRDSCEGHPCCILCGKPAPTDAPLAFSNAHYISRAQGGLGIEKNILTLCWKCHSRFDASEERKQLKTFFRGYLRSVYPDWDEKDLYFQK